MTALPTGTVTFLFTDIEGSTRLLHELGDRYADVLAEHRRVLRAAFDAHGGVEVDTQGDAFFVAFARASDALAAAGEAQAGLDDVVRVRMGVHTGEPLVTDEGYVGIDVHRAARVAAAGHGGQVLVSQSTRDLACADGLRDLGEHRLKDLTAPERIYQLGDHDFPPLKSLNATNLPVASSALVGRERELEEISALVKNSARLVTLTGPGGTGKTRLALQVAAELVDDFAGGVFFVPLAGVQQPELVPATIASTIGVHEVSELRDRNALVLLDNFEHLLDAAPAVGEVLRRASRAKVIVTSRAPLRVDGEREYPIDSLPDDDAVELLTDRARAVRPDFAPDDATVEIVHRLDGLPLALELAASRLRSLGSAALLDRLGQRLPVLTTGRRDAPERQRTLRATIEWSYDLLDERLQEIFARLGVFATFTLEAAEAVADATFDDVDTLVEASLLKSIRNDRFLMLETIREFALERLAAGGREEDVRLRHAEFFARLAASANLHEESEGPMRHDLVGPELDNIRAALQWTLATGRQSLGLRLAVDLETFWVTTDPAESARWIEALLALGDQTDPALTAFAYRCLGNGVGLAGDARGERLHEESLERFRALGNHGAAACVLHRLAMWALRRGDTPRALELLDESDRLNEAACLGKLAAENLFVRAEIEGQAGRLEAALQLYEDSLARCRETGFPWWEENALQMAALTLFSLGRCAEATDRAQQALAVAARIEDRTAVLEALALCARGCTERGDKELAGRLLGAIDAELERAPASGWEARHESFVRPLLVHRGSEFDAGRLAGRDLSLEDAVDLALR